jgi:hypothetical protein
MNSTSTDITLIKGIEYKIENGTTTDVIYSQYQVNFFGFLGLLFILLAIFFGTIYLIRIK